MPKEDLYSFAPNTKAAHVTLEQQALKVVEEALEVLDAVDGGEEPKRIREECFDVIQAVEGVLRRYEDEECYLSRAQVKLKCMRRGDYQKDGKQR